MATPSKTLNLPDNNKTYRVVQWATGKVGSRSLRAIIQHPTLELVGLYVFSESKEGRDAGELCGIDPIGVKATRNIDDIIALQPDCVMYMQEGANVDDVCKLLQAGINIVTTRNEFFNGDKMNPEIRDRVKEACIKGGATLHATGSSPGFITEAMPLVLTSVARRVDCITIDEFAYIPESCSPEMIFEVMGYGREAGGEFDAGMLHHMAEGFAQSLYTTAHALGLDLDGIEAEGEMATASERIEVAPGAFLEPGTVAAQRIIINGMHNGKPLIRFRANWYCATEIDKDWYLGENGWRVVVDGDTPFDLIIKMPATDEPSVERLGGYTAHRAVNAVPFVCAAAPGIATISDLPNITARLA